MVKSSRRSASKAGSSEHKIATLWNRPAFLARRFHQINVAIFVEKCAEANITPIQWGVMTTVADEPGLGYGEIALAMGIDRHNAADVAVRLAEKGIVTISVSETDKRKTCIFITKKGRALMERFDERVKESQQHALDPLSPADRKTLMDLLRRILEHNNGLSRAPIRVSERAD